MTQAQGKTAVVLGGSDGIGKACALALAADCARVVLFSRSADKLAAAAADIVVAHPRVAVTTVVGDMADAKAIDALAQAHACDVLVVSGGGPAAGDVGSMTDEAWEKGFDTTALPVLRALRVFSAPMAARGAGRIVVIGSVSTHKALDNLDVSNFVRPGLLGVVRALAKKLAPRGVTVNMVCPGSILTERSRQRIAARATQNGQSFDEALAVSTKAVPIGRLGAPEEVAAAVAFLASSAAGYVTGVALPVDGGLLL